MVDNFKISKIFSNYNEIRIDFNNCSIFYKKYLKPNSVECTKFIHNFDCIYRVAEEYYEMVLNLIQMCLDMMHQ